MKFFNYIFITLFIVSCQNKNSVTIAISKASGDPVYKNYINWIKDINPNIKIIDLYSKPYKEALKLAKIADGVLLSGGPDIHPEYFGKKNEADRCSIESKRDTLEMALIKQTLEDKKPIFGICSVMQILNVALGGTLIIDIPEDYPAFIPNLHQTKEPGDAIHTTFLQDDKYLTKLIGNNEAIINCNHHQGIENLAPELVASSFSADAMIESFEWKSPENKSWMIGVQWHPERNENKELFAKLAKEFINKVIEYREFRL